jgi:hypothetical protein
MKSLRISGTLLAVALLMFTFGSVANAQATRTWVSGVGDDANPCSRTAPCKTFAGAISKTADGGEINCLDPGGFGAVTITKSIKIDCGTLTGGILAAGTTGIIINANATNARIIIRGLEIFGVLTTNAGTQPLGTNGIRYLAAKNVHLENVYIAGFNTTCVDQNTTAASNLTMLNVQLEECPVGLNVRTTSGVAVAVLNNVAIYSTTTAGIRGQENSIVTAHDSDVSLNNVAVQQTASANSMNLVANTFANNGTVITSAAGTVRIVGNAFVQNGTIAGAGSVLSDATNTNAGNGVVGAIGALPAPIKF